MFVKALASRPVSARAAKEDLRTKLRQIFVDARLIGWSAAQMSDFVTTELEQRGGKAPRFRKAHCCDS